MRKNINSKIKWFRVQHIHMPDQNDPDDVIVVGADYVIPAESMEDAIKWYFSNNFLHTAENLEDIICKIKNRNYNLEDNYYQVECEIYCSGRGNKYLDASNKQIGMEVHNFYISEIISQEN